jgi:ArsR family transcriptional regulator, arsenate/arsenite/antimonite-responsive transcriptional repressor
MNAPTLALRTRLRIHFCAELVSEEHHGMACGDIVNSHRGVPRGRWCPKGRRAGKRFHPATPFRRPRPRNRMIPTERNVPGRKLHLREYTYTVVCRMRTIVASKHRPLKTSDSAAALIRIYECFCDETRLRIVNLLTQGPLCVCHLQELLDSSQVKISKHLRYLKAKGILNAERHQNWMIYSIPAHPSAELEANLKCLQDCVQTHSVFRRDLRQLAKIRSRVAWLTELCVADAQKE